MLGFLGRLITNRAHPEISINELYKMLKFGDLVEESVEDLVASVASNRKALRDAASDSDSEELDDLEPEDMTDILGELRAAVTVKADKKELQRAAGTQFPNSKPDKVRRHAPHDLTAFALALLGHTLVLPLPMFETFTKGVTIDSQPRHCQPARKHMKSQNTSAFFQMNFDNIPNPLRSKLEQLGWQPEVVCGEIQSFLKGSFADGGDCAIAKVKIFKPEGFDPLLMLAESQIDLVDRDHYVYGWVCANDLGDVVGLGKGAPGYPQANINLWSVLRVRCDQHTRF
jgi:hypothetical protein